MTIKKITINFFLFFCASNYLLCQQIINYTPDNHLHAITHLSKKLNYVYGLDNQSIDYYKVINANYSIFYNLESETFSLKEDATNFIVDRLELFKIKDIKHNERTVTKLNSSLKEFHYKGIGTSFICQIKQISKTVYNYGLVRTSNNISLLQINVDTLQLKLSYKLIPIYDHKYKYFTKKNKSDSVFSFSLFEGTVQATFSFRNDIVFEVASNLIRVKSKYDFIDTYFSSNKPNELKGFNKLSEEIIDVLDTDTILTINKDGNSIFYYNSSYNLQYNRKIVLDSNINKMELVHQELLTDPITRNKFVHLKFKKDSLIDVFYNLNDLTKCIYKIASTDWHNNIEIRNNSILLKVIHPIDKHIYVYELTQKINANLPNYITLGFRTKSKLNNENTNTNTSLCQSNRSLFYDKLFKADKKYIVDSYELLDKNKANLINEKSEIGLVPKQETINELMESIIACNNAKQYSVILSELLIYKKNSSDTIVYKILNEQNYDVIKNGINDIAEQLKKVSDIPQKEENSKNNYEIELYTNDGNTLTLVRLKRKWYCVASYYKKMD